MPTAPKRFEPMPRPRSDRPTASRRGYTYRWQKASRAYLQENPLCLHCDRAGRAEEATVVDHVTPHRGDDVLFWSVENWQPLCATCHNKKTAQGM